MHRIFHTIRTALRPDFGTRIYLLSLVVGLVGGGAAIAFTYGLEFARFICLEWAAGFRPVHPAGEITFDFSGLAVSLYEGRTWVLLLLPALGGLVGGYITWRLAPEASGPGTSAVIDAFHNRRGVVRLVVAPVKALATVVTLATGGSAGKEGPMVQIGASLGSWLGQRLRLSATQRRLLLLAGTSAGLGAIFRAPLGGAVRTVEVLYQEDFESDALIPCVISSIVAYSFYMGVFGFSHIFDFPGALFTDVRELVAYLALGVICALGGLLYIHVFSALRDRFFGRLPLPPYMVTALGGLLVGAIALYDQRVLYTGFGVVQQGLWGQLGLRALLTLALLKILATACTIGSGGSGGVFGPSLFIGGMLGGAVGLVVGQLFPSLPAEPAAYMVVGMASFLAAVSNTPLAALIMVTEMTGSYHLLPPLMLVSAFALIFTRRFSIYQNQVANKFRSPAHLKDFTVDVLQNLRVADILPGLRHAADPVVTNDTPYYSLDAVSRRLGLLHFIVVDGERRVLGMIRLDELELPADEALRSLVLIEDTAVTPVEAVEAGDDLHRALEKVLSSGFDKLPVVEEAGGALVGHLTHQDILRLYDEEVDRIGQTD